MHSEVPVGWKNCSVSDVTKIITKGTTPTSVGYNFQTDGIPFLKVENIAKDGTILLNSINYISQECHNKLARSIIKQGTILFSIAGTLGRVAKYEEPYEANTNQALAILRGISENFQFVYFALQSTSIKELIKKQKTVGAQANISLRQIGAFPILTPPLSEQERIVEILTSVDDSIRATERVIEQAERLKRGLMEELLTGGLGSAAIERGEVPVDWEQTTFGEITQVVGGTTPKREVDEYWNSDDILWATPTDITALPNGVMEISDTRQKASTLAVTKGGLKVFPKDSVLMTSRATIGFVAIAKKEISTNQGFANFLPNLKYIPKYLAYLLHNMRDEFISRASGSTFKEISKGVLKKIILNLPPLAEQERIAEILTSVDEEISANRNSVEQLQRVKRGLMDDLLTGKVRTV